MIWQPQQQLGRILHRRLSVFGGCRYLMRKCWLLHVRPDRFTGRSGTAIPGLDTYQLPHHLACWASQRSSMAGINTEVLDIGYYRFNCEIPHFCYFSLNGFFSLKQCLPLNLSFPTFSLSPLPSEMLQAHTGNVHLQSLQNGPIVITSSPATGAHFLFRSRATSLPLMPTHTLGTRSSARAATSSTSSLSSMKLVTSRAPWMPTTLARPS
jgi:hypothetical protein